jgi:predicted ATPase
MVISTQSTELLNKFSAEDIVVVDRKGGSSSLYRIDLDELEEWLANKSLSEIWSSSIIGGQPTL